MSEILDPSFFFARLSARLQTYSHCAIFAPPSIDCSSKTVGGSCLTWLAIVLTSLAFFASLATIASCEYVRHENDDPNVADAEMMTAGIYCFDSSVFDSWNQLGSTSVRIFVQVVAAIATFLGLVMVIMLWKTTRKPHGKCYHRTMGFFSK